MLENNYTPIKINFKKNMVIYPTWWSIQMTLMFIQNPINIPLYFDLK